MKKQNTMKFFTRLLPVLFLLICAMVINQKTFAQCTIVSVDSLGNFSTLSITCDFPIGIDTGDPYADSLAYAIEKNNFLANNPGATPPIFPGSNESISGYIEIPAVEFSLFSSARQDAIELQPDIYHIIQ